MTAALSMRVRYGTSPGTLTSAQTGADLSSADNGENSSSNRQNNPIVAGQRSYEKYTQLYVDTAPDNYVQNFEVWGDGAVQAETTLYCGITASYATPVSTASSVATNDWTNYTSGSKLTWDAGPLTAQDEVTDYLVFQLSTTSSATAGNWTQETVNYSYQEA